MPIPPENALFERTLHTQGLFEALRFLNGLTCYRFTGVYRFEPGWVKCVVLFDKKNPDLRIGEDVPWKNSYCMLTSEHGNFCAIQNSLADDRIANHPSRESVRSYCSVLLRRKNGRQFGTLCHFDTVARETPEGIIEQLCAVRPAIERFLWTKSGASSRSKKNQLRNSPVSSTTRPRPTKNS